MLKILHSPSRHPERLKNLLEFYSKRLFLRKSRHKKQISILKSPSADLRNKTKKFFLFLSHTKKNNQFFLRFLDFRLRKLINLSIVHHNRLRNYPLFQKSSKKISKFSPIIREQKLEGMHLRKEKN